MGVYVFVIHAINMNKNVIFISFLITTIGMLSIFGITLQSIKADKNLQQTSDKFFKHCRSGGNEHQDQAAANQFVNHAVKDEQKNGRTVTASASCNGQSG